MLAMTSLEDFKRTISERVFLRSSDNVRITHAGSGTPRETPWLFDFRAIILEPQWLNAYAEFFWEKYAHCYPFQVGGMETAGIPLVAAIVMKGVERGTPVNGFFIRKSRKREGLMKVIEGTLTDAPVILVDDLINSGGSFLKQILILDDAGKRVSHIFTILAFRSSDAYEPAHTRGIQIDWLFTLNDFGLPLEGTTPVPTQNTFAIEWRISLPAIPAFEHIVQKSAPVIDDKNIYIGSDSGTFFAIRQDDGTIAWAFDVEKHPKGKGIFSSPALHDGVVYFGAYDGNVYALSASTGALIWKYSDADWIGSSPALDVETNTLFIGLEFGLWKKRGGIAAVDMRTGKTKWTARHPSLTHASPLYIKKESMVVIGSNDGFMYAYDANTGREKWRYQSGADIKTRAVYDSKRRIVLVPSMDSKLYALSVKDGAPLWAFQCGAGIYSNPLINGDVVYIASLDKSIYAIDVETGREKAEFATGGRIFASPILADKSLWIGSNDGKLYELDPATLQLRGDFQASERIINAIAHNPSTKRFFVPTVANELYCLKRK